MARGDVALWLLLFDERRQRRWPNGARTCRRASAPSCIDSRAVRARFELPEFTGQLFVHAIGAAGHDVVKYALDTYGERRRARLLLHPRRQFLAGRFLCRPAGARRGRDA